MKAPLADKILDSALELAARKPWESVALPELASACGLSLEELRGQIEDKDEILFALHERLDKATLAATAFEGAAKERLFDLFMARFDAMQAHRDGYVSMLKAVKFQPPVLARGACAAYSSMGWLLDAAGLRNNDMNKAVLSFAYLNTLRVWVNDDSADLSATMAAADQSLEKATRFLA